MIVLWIIYNLYKVYSIIYLYISSIVWLVVDVSSSSFIFGENCLLRMLRSIELIVGLMFDIKPLCLMFQSYTLWHELLTLSAGNFLSSFVSGLPVGFFGKRARLRVEVGSGSTLASTYIYIYINPNDRNKTNIEQRNKNTTVRHLQLEHWRKTPQPNNWTLNPNSLKHPSILPSPCLA